MGVTGGKQDGSWSASTWFVDLTKTRFTPGPKMTSRRNAHACSTLQLGRKTFGIVAGGYLDSTEWIDLEEDSPTWTEGPKLPRGLQGLTLIETTQGTYALGGNFRTEVLKLDCPGNQIQSCQWQEMPEKLEVGREDHVSLALPESYDICNGTATTTPKTSGTTAPKTNGTTTTTIATTSYPKTNGTATATATATAT